MLAKLVRIGTIAALRAGGALSTLGLYFVIRRYYDAPSSANMMFMITAITFCTPIFLYGLNTYSVKLVANEDAKAVFIARARGVVSRLVRLNLPLAALLSLLAFALSWSGYYTSMPWLAPLYLVLIAPLYTLIAAFLQGLRRYNESIFISAICMSLTLAVLILVSQQIGAGSSADPAAVSIYIMSACVFTLCIAVALFARAFPGVLGSSWLTTRNTTLLSDDERKQSRTFWYVYMLIAVGTWAPQIAYYVSGARADYANFSVAERLANLINFFAIISNFYLSPIAASAHAKQQYDELRTSFYTITAAMLAPSSIILVVLLIFPGLPLSLFGSDTPSAHAYIRIMAIAQFINVATGSVNTLLIMIGKERLLVKSLLVSVGAQLAATLAGGALFGGLGYAISFAIYIVVQSRLSWLYLKPVLDVSVGGMIRHNAVMLRRLVRN